MRPQAAFFRGFCARCATTSPPHSQQWVAIWMSDHERDHNEHDAVANGPLIGVVTTRPKGETPSEEKETNGRRNAEGHRPAREDARWGQPGLRAGSGTGTAEVRGRDQVAGGGALLQSAPRTIANGPLIDVSKTGR